MYAEDLIVPDISRMRLCRNSIIIEVTNTVVNFILARGNDAGLAGTRTVRGRSSCGLVGLASSELVTKASDQAYNRPFEPLKRSS